MNTQQQKVKISDCFHITLVPLLNSTELLFRIFNSGDECIHFITKEQARALIAYLERWINTDALEE